MPGEESDISIELSSPDQCGIYQSQYRLFTGNNVPFGDPIWLVLNVEVGGVLGITQQLNSVNMFGNMSSNQTNINITNNNCSSTFLNQFSAPTKSNIFNLLPSTTTTTNNNNNNNNNYYKTITTNYYQSASNNDNNDNNNNNKNNLFGSSITNTTKTTNSTINTNLHESYSPTIATAAALATSETTCNNIQHQSLNENENEDAIAYNNPILDDEKRPDFYDDMFS